MAPLPSERRVAELRIDLQVERSKLNQLVHSLDELQRLWLVPEATKERCDAAALRLQSLYTGIERCFVQIVRVLNGGPPEGADWHRQSLDLWPAVEQQLQAFEFWLQELAAHQD